MPRLPSLRPLFLGLTPPLLALALQAQGLPTRELRPGMVFVQAPGRPERPGFWILRTETTRAAWRMVMGSEPWTLHQTEPPPGDDLPVAFVTWREVQAFLARLNDADPDFHYRLPSEAEWEEASLGGAAADPEDLEPHAWFDRNAFLAQAKRTQPVARKAGNGWGLHDCLGNVWEWVQDAQGSDARVIKGGSWRTSREVTRTSERNWLAEDQFAGDLGFRVLATPVEDGLWSDWRPLAAGAEGIRWRVRWVQGEADGRVRWILNLHNEGDRAMDLGFLWGLPDDQQGLQVRLEPGRIHAWQGSLRRTAKAQRPTVTCLAWRLHDPTF